MNRRSLLTLGGLAAIAGATPAWARTRASAQTTPTAPSEQRADYTIRIANGLVELAPDRIVSTTTYNGQFPGSLLRLKQDQRVVVDIHNDTDTPEQLQDRRPGHGRCDQGRHHARRLPGDGGRLHR